MARKLSELSQRQLLTKLRNIPQGSYYMEIHSHLETILEKKYHDDHVLCFRRFNESQLTSNLLKGGFYNTFSDDFNKNVMKINDFGFIKRAHAEYNPEYIQLNCMAVIINKSRNKIVLLDRPDFDTTMVGGHVDFDYRAYNMSVLEIIRFNMIKELSEEIKNGISYAKYLSEEPILVCSTEISDGDTKFYDIFHNAVIFEIVVPDELIEGIESGEKSHTTKVYSLDDVSSIKKKKRWITEYLDYVEQINHSIMEHISTMNKADRDLITNKKPQKMTANQ